MKTETVTWVHHWTDKTFSFKTTRSQTFRFNNGEFAMIGLMVDDKPLLRAYSIASANYEDELLVIDPFNGEAYKFKSPEIRDDLKRNVNGMYAFSVYNSINHLFYKT